MLTPKIMRYLIIAPAQNLLAVGGPETMYPEFVAKLKDPASTEAAARAKVSPSAGPPHVSRAVGPDSHDGEIHVLPVQGNIYMLIGDGGNIAVQVGPQVTLVVDTATGRLADKVLAAIRKLSDHPIQFIVNNSFHLDHAGGNMKFRDVGYDPSYEGSFYANHFTDAGAGATIIGHQNVQNRLSALTDKTAAIPAAGWPSDTFLKGRRRKFHNGEALEIFWERDEYEVGEYRDMIAILFVIGFKP